MNEPKFARECSEWVEGYYDMYNFPKGPIVTDFMLSTTAGALVSYTTAYVGGALARVLFCNDSAARAVGVGASICIGFVSGMKVAEYSREVLLGIRYMTGK